MTAWVNEPLTGVEADPPEAFCVACGWVRAGVDEADARRRATLHDCDDEED